MSYNLERSSKKNHGSQQANSTTVKHTCTSPATVETQEAAVWWHEHQKPNSKLGLTPQMGSTRQSPFEAMSNRNIIITPGKLSTRTQGEGPMVQWLVALINRSHQLKIKQVQVKQLINPVKQLRLTNHQKGEIKWNRQLIWFIQRHHQWQKMPPNVASLKQVCKARRICMGRWKGVQPKFIQQIIIILGGYIIHHEKSSCCGSQLGRPFI